MSTQTEPLLLPALWVSKVGKTNVIFSLPRQTNALDWQRDCSRCSTAVGAGKSTAHPFECSTMHSSAVHVQSCSVWQILLSIFPNTNPNSCICPLSQPKYICFHHFFSKLYYLIFWLLKEILIKFLLIIFVINKKWSNILLTDSETLSILTRNWNT